MTPQGIFLLDKLIVAQPVKIPAFYGTQKLVAVLTRTHLCSISWTKQT